jgi:hypothetical protein
MLFSLQNSAHAGVGQLSSKRLPFPRKVLLRRTVQLTESCALVYPSVDLYLISVLSCLRAEISRFGYQFASLPRFDCYMSQPPLAFLNSGVTACLQCTSVPLMFLFTVTAIRL